MNKAKVKKHAWYLVGETLAGMLNAGWPFEAMPYREFSRADHERLNRALVEIAGYCARMSRENHR